MARIPQQFIDELIARSDIHEIVSARVELKKAGHEYKGLCPFHTEKSPSFTLSPAKQFYHCFGCGAHGTVISFLMEYDKLEFLEAIEQLAHRAGLEIPKEASSEPDKQSQPIYDVLVRAAMHFRKQLKANAGAIDYLKRRGLDGEAVATYGIGFAPPGWDRLVNALGKDENTRRLLVEAGLANKRDDGGYYDRFRNRIMFPIRDLRGRVVGFGGRVVDDAEPKYLNSPETPVFHKGREVYGLYEARKAPGRIDKLIVVEGYMDAVVLAQNGIHNVAATLGTATTTDHIGRLFRLADHIVFAFDGDKAGRRAAWRALENCLPTIRRGRQFRFLFLPDGEDPDSMVRKDGKDGFLKRLEDAVPLSEFFLDELARQTDPDSVDGRARLVELARPYLERIPVGVYRELLSEALAERAGTGTGTLDRVMGSEPVTAVRPRRRATGISAGRGNLVRQAISLIVHYPDLASGADEIGAIRGIDRPGVPLLVQLIESLRDEPVANTAALLERWRERENGRHLARLAAAEVLVDLDGAAAELGELLRRLVAVDEPARRREALLSKARAGELSTTEKRELQALLAAKSGPTEVVRN